eukprot:TRINITY_DN4377_c0_g1_i1.p1 TRINITY_DN4377_c0_g1~~TRINITY_DN4377_c0_g1_i1.p1  ORF type:complete len:383 (+),score=89.37 TRINITY_DN4377_c0_g1_i1:62-1210(+)
MENKEAKPLPKDLLPQHILDAENNQVKLDTVIGIKNSVVALYFSASWCPPCARLTPQLAVMYKQLKASGKNFEIILVCPESPSDSAKYFGHMPWKSLPHDQSKLKQELFEMFGIQGIPSLLLFDGETGKQISDSGIERIFEHGPDAFPWSDEKIEEMQLEQRKKMDSKSVAELLGSADLINNKGEKIPVNSIQKDIIGFYFSAHWCPPCKGFTPVLADVYNQLKTQGKSFEIVFVSSDRSESEFQSYFATMPWLSFPYSDREAKTRLSNFYLVQGIPTLVLINGKTGSLITLEGRGLVGGLKASGYPYTVERIKQIKEEEDEKMKNLPKSVKVALHDHNLELLETIYDGDYECNGCGREGAGWVYHCDECNFDLHPGCTKNP